MGDISTHIKRHRSVSQDPLTIILARHVGVGSTGDAAFAGGMTDMVAEGDEVTIYTSPESLHKVVMYLESKGKKVEGTLGYRPKTTVTVENQAKVEAFLEAVSDYDDVQEVYANLG